MRNAFAVVTVLMVVAGGALVMGALALVVALVSGSAVLFVTLWSVCWFSLFRGSSMKRSSSSPILSLRTVEFFAGRDFADKGNGLWPT